MAKGSLQKIARHLYHIRQILVNGVWISVILVVLAGVGWYFVGNSILDKNTAGHSDDAVISEKSITPPIDWQQVDAAVMERMQNARIIALSYAEKEMDNWLGLLAKRIDESFLDWYFNYWTQQILGLKGLYQYGLHHIIASQPDAAERLTEEIQVEFSRRVLQPEIAQKTLERIIDETVLRYVEQLQGELAEIPNSYRLQDGEWQRYLEDIAIISGDAAGTRETPLTLKALTVGGTGSAVLLGANIKAMSVKLSGKTLAQSSGKVASSMAAKTGGKVAAKVGGKFFGTIAGIGVLAWDLWDHNNSQKENRPLLRESLMEYLAELKHLLLRDPQYGVNAALYSLEAGFSRSLKK